MSENTGTAKRELSISRLINAPQELVWEAWTNPEHIKHWWGPVGFESSISKMEVKTGGEWEFIMHGSDGTDYKNKHIYLELEKPSKIVMKHVSFPPFVMTATFEAQGNKTLVSLHSLFESEEQLAEVIKVFKADEGMKQNIARMDEYITTGMTNLMLPVVVERLFNAPAEKIWKALTDKNEMKKWYFQLDEFRAEPGFEFRFYGQGHKGDRYLHICIITEIEENKKLSYTWVYDNIPGSSLVSFELFPEGDKTRLRVSHSGLHTFAGHGADFAKESFTKGWTFIIGTSLFNYLNDSDEK